MAFIECPNCGEQMDAVHIICPHCHTSLKHHSNAVIARSLKLGVVSLIIASVFCFIGVRALSNDIGSIVGIFSLSIGITALIPSYAGFSGYKTEMRKRHLAETDYVAYREYVEKEKIKVREYQESLKKQQETQEATKYNSYRYKCPMCSSNKIMNISTAKKVVSTELLGLASNKIGKTYQCDECKYMW